MSARPKRSTTVVANASTAAGSLTSDTAVIDVPALGPHLVGDRLDVPPAGLLLVGRVVVGARPVPVSTTSQPARARRTAIGRPIDRIRPAPVTTATFPSNPVSS